MIHGTATSSQPRNPLGEFERYKQDQIDRAKALQREYQQDVARRISNDIGSKATHQRVHTGRLVKATLDPRNAPPPSSTSWKVGIPEYLNKSVAKYWRTFEFGSGEGPGKWRKPFIGTVLYGRFVEGNAFIPASRLQPSDEPELQPVAYKVKHEIQGHESYRKAWYGNGWDRRVQQDFTQVLGRHFGQKYGGK